MTLDETVDWRYGVVELLWIGSNPGRTMVQSVMVLETEIRRWRCGSVREKEDAVSASKV